MTNERVRPGGYLIAAEAGLLALALGTATSLTRLFTGWSFLGRMLLPLVAAWGLAATLRRLGIRTGAATTLHVLLGVVVLAWWFAADTLWLVVPTPETARVLGELVSSSFAEFSDLVAPVPASDGFLLVALAVLWVFASFADTAAFRYGSPVQAAVPHTAAFVAVGILARDSGRTTAAVWFAAGLGTYAVTQRALAALDQRWVAGRGREGARSVALGAAGLAVIALVVGLVIGPRLPGDDTPVLDVRELGSGDGPRTVVSPFVGLRSLLGERSDDVMFRVETDAPSYWRLTALEEYDAEREIWVSRGTTYLSASDELGGSLGALGPARPLDQRVTIEGLAGPWLPAAYVPTEVDAPGELLFDPASASLIVSDDQAFDAGFEYAVRSQVPRPGEDVGDLERPNAFDDLDAEFSRTPELAPVVLAQLDSVVDGVDGPGEQLLALQDWFRSSFDYDEAVDFTDATDPIVAFLDQRRGFCQQFASTFALMARSLGFPSRVAIGFTQGDATDPDDDAAGDAATPSFVVRGRHAHAWPEVYLDGAGWVSFEPTPQRGDPQAETHTGVPPQQAAAPPEQAATTTAAPTTAPEGPTGPEDSPPLEDLAADAAPEAAGGDGDRTVAGSGGPNAGTLAAVASAASLVAVLAALARRWSTRRWRRAARTSEHARVVAGAWRHAQRSLHAVGIEPRPDETPVELAARARTILEVDLLDELAALETRRRYAAGDPGAEAATRAITLSDELDAHVVTITTRRERLRHALVP